MSGTSGALCTLLRRRLEAARKTPDELAESLDLPASYVAGILDGSVPPPHPALSDVYDRMTRTVKAARHELANAAEADRQTLPSGSPAPAVVKALLAMCEPATSEVLRERRHRGQLHEALERLLQLMHASVSRVLSDTVSVRAIARRRGISYAEQRELILRFLDATASTVDVAQVREFIEPRLARWDVALETGVLRLVLHGQQAADVHRRRPSNRRTV